MTDMTKILEPGRPGDLLMIFEVGVNAIEALKDKHFESGFCDQDDLQSIARTLGLALEMWRGEIPVADAPFEGMLH